MTKAQVADLRAKLKQQGASPLHCYHQLQELTHLSHSDNGNMTGTYHCLECGEEIIRTYIAPPYSSPPLID